MNYKQSNVGPGMVPHKKNCRCDECHLDRLQDRVETLEAERRELAGLANRAKDMLTRIGLARPDADDGYALVQDIREFFDKIDAQQQENSDA